ncbi:MAG TPA: DUF6249 domain-containing protein [Steroidobacteraceae bacterium]|nr:DUF6249 domain-containing protein [Steroidobacteraceae bacterium]
MNENQMALLIPIIAVIMSMSVAIVFILAVHRHKTKQLEQRHKERMAAIDKGLDFPMDPVKLDAPSRPRYLLRGLVWLGVGLAIVYGARPALEDQASGFGWIPVAVGIAYLIFYFVEGRKESGIDKPTPPTGLISGSNS